MGGDHRCPVCQATFTRPQHVARHMRSRKSPTPPNPAADSPQTPATAPTSVCTAVISLPEGALTSPSSCHRCSHLPAICFPAIATSATPTKNLLPPPGPVVGAPPLPRGQPPQSKLAINASSPVFRVMGPILAVRPLLPLSYSWTS